ncbi:hypothetical protein DL93DRAFT_2096263 [Clavulina sp. PMI_390]|nr:hypothetical protein DL93DRAFT_2096263 [Clavulina sp. PMI_390]
MPLSKLSGLVKRASTSVALNPSSPSGLDSSEAHSQGPQNSRQPPPDSERISPLLPLPVYSLIVHLPNDVLIELLSHSLFPRDLVSVSHTCRTLRAVVDSTTIIWERAWRRDLTMSRPYHRKLSSPPTDHMPIVNHPMEDNAVASSETFPTAHCGSPQPLGFRLQSPQEFSPPACGSLQWNPYQRQYWNTMRIRRELSLAQPALKPVGTILNNHPTGEFLTSRIAQDGDLIVLGIASGVKLLHLELGVALSISIDFQDAVLEEQGVPIPLISQGFCLDGQEGFLFTSTFRRRNEILLYFVPLDHFNTSPSAPVPKPAQFFADITLPVGRIVQRLVFLGRFLTIKSIRHSSSQGWSYRVFDPDSRLTYRLPRGDTRATLMTVVGDKFFIFLYSSNELEIYALPSSDDSVPDGDLELILVPQDLVPKHRPLQCSVHETLLPTAYFSPKARPGLAGVSYRSLHIMEGPPDQGSLGVESSQFWWTETQPTLRSPFKTTFPDLASPRHFPATQGRVHIPRFLRRLPGVRIDHFCSIGHFYAGPTSVLIGATPAGKVDAPIVIAHPVFEKGVAGPVEIEQKPVLIQGQKKKKGQPILKRPDCGVADHHFNFMWNEETGRVVLLTSDGDNLRLDLYKF